MKNKSFLAIEKLESYLPRWEKWLYLILGAAIIMLIQGIIKNYENKLLTDLMFSLAERGVDVWRFLPLYGEWSFIFLSPWRLLLWLIVEMAALLPAAILGLHPLWRRVALTKRLDLIGGFLLVGWVNLLALGATDPLNMPDEYNALLILYLLLFGSGYWFLRRRRDRAEEIFP
ncbi:MAG: hypothetical protein QXS54_11510 [Candidatus Methanomethylicaceae archaeon]